MTTTADGKSLGQRIKIGRQGLGIRQEELAKRLRVTAQHISAIELGRRSPSLDFLARLAEQLDVTTDYLITGKQQDVVDPVVAIVSDNTLPNEAKKALIILVKFLRKAASPKS